MSARLRQAAGKERGKVMMTPAQAARKAAEIIAERGLAREILQDEEGHVCHNGAIFMAVAGDARGSRASEEQVNLVNQVISGSEEVLRRDGDVRYPFQFSDDPATSAEDVMLLLKKAAEVLEGKE
jgi:hypothetical protein